MKLKNIYIIFFLLLIKFIYLIITTNLIYRLNININKLLKIFLIILF